MSLSLLLPFAWKSALIAGVALASLAVMRRASARDRALLLQGAVVLLLLLPAVAMLAPLELASPAPAMIAEQAPAAAVARYADAQPARIVAAFARAPQEADAPLGVWDWPALMLGLYAAGVAALLLRLAGGLVMLARWTRRATPVDDAAWLEALAASGWEGRVRLRLSADVPAPLSWSPLTPVILIDPASVARPGDAAAILAHELAHIARHDWPTLIASRIARALFWFNPLVWLLDRALIQQCEEAADAQALAACDGPDYAAALIACLGRTQLRAVPANGMAAGHGLARRVRQVLDVDAELLARRSRLALAGMVVALGFVVPAMAVRFVAPSAASDDAADAAAAAAAAEKAATRDNARVHVISYRDQNGERVSETTIVENGKVTVTRTRGGDDPAPPVPPAPPSRPGETTMVQDQAWPHATPTPPVPPLPPAPPRIVADAQWAASEGRVAAAQASLHAEGARRLGEQARRIGIDANAIAERARAEAQRAVETALPGTRDLRAMGFSQDGANRLAAVGATPTYVRDMRAVGYKRISADDLTKLWVLGVTPSDVRKASAARGGRLPAPGQLGEELVLDGH